MLPSPTADPMAERMNSFREENVSRTALPPLLRVGAVFITVTLDGIPACEHIGPGI
ncbi:hypothetical protein GCM10022377_10650 [Zhihengliuella alba]|uniref:Uncharacterized protein n=1 Tax=Zhihengliuella alba TaxID=547018 RepID=A0ABP7D500_9MICC